MNQKIIRKISLLLVLVMIIGIFQGREVFAAPKKGYKLYSTKLKEIDVYKENKKPAGRNYNLTWDSSIFYNVEGLSGKKGVLTLKDYKVSRKVLKNKKTGNRMEYEVYKHPKTGIIHKIVSIEYRKKDLELTDYYYTNDGKPNFIFQRRDSIYTPTYADTNKTGERYYFNSDNMITWRWVDKPYDVKERTTKKHQSEAKPQYLYTDASESEKKAYDKREVKMLNAAYNTLAAMKEKNEHGRLQGYVTDTKGKPVKGAKVEIYVEGKRIGELTTNQKGLYETGITRNKKGYDLKISAKGLKTVEVKGVKIGETDEVILIKVVILVKTEKKENAVNLNLFDAEATKAGKKGYQKKQVGDAKIFVRKGVDNKKGKTVLEAKGDKKGRVNLKLPNGVYTLEIIRKGYITVYQTLVVEGNEKVSLPLVKKPKKKGMKIVLNWKGKADLDSILFTPKKGEKGDMAYVGAGKKKEGKTKLVLDGKAGYTTEVIVIEDAKNGNFKYYVSDYTKAKKKQFTSKDLKKLKLLVYVYDENGLVEVFTLPFDVNGIVWEVFEVKNGKVLPLQKTYNNVKGKKWWTKEKREGKRRKKIIPLKYDDVGVFSEGLAKVRIGNWENGKWGFINKEGKEVIPLKYDWARKFSEGLAGVKKGDKWGFIDTKGREVVTPQYHGVEEFSKGLAAVRKGDKYGYIDIKGREVAPPQYYRVLGFSEGLAAVQKGDKWGYIDTRGREVVPPQYDWIWGKFSEGLEAVQKGDKWGFIDTKGREVIPLKYDEANGFSEGLASISIGGKWGYINKLGKVVIPIKYDYAYHFSEGMALVIGSKDKKSICYIDKRGREIVKTKYIYSYFSPIDIQSEFSEGLAGFYDDKGKVEVINKKGKKVTPFKYDAVGYFSDGLAPVEYGGKYGYINKKGEIVIPFKYQRLIEDSLVERGFLNGYSKVYLEGKYGLIHRSGREVIKPEYDEVMYPELEFYYVKFKDNDIDIDIDIDVVPVRKDDVWYLIRRKGGL